MELDYFQVEWGYGGLKDPQEVTLDNRSVRLFIVLCLAFMCTPWQPAELWSVMECCCDWVLFWRSICTSCWYCFDVAVFNRLASVITEGWPSFFFDCGHGIWWTGELVTGKKSIFVDFVSCRLSWWMHKQSRWFNRFMSFFSLVFFIKNYVTSYLYRLRFRNKDSVAFGWFWVSQKCYFVHVLLDPVFTWSILHFMFGMV